MDQHQPTRPAPVNEGESEEKFARRLAELHEALLSGVGAAGIASDSESRQSASAEPSLQPLAELLQLLDRTRKSNHQNDAMLETGNDNRDATLEVPAQPIANLAATASVPLDPSLAHLQIGRFQLVRLAGKGGFGVVYLAQDPQLNRLIALKIPRPEAILSPDLRQRFLREGRAAACLSHPNLVTVYEAGQDGPICYLASEWVRGSSLNEWLESHTITQRQVAQLMIPLASAMQHAHSRGVLHRDLKPANVLMDESVPRITDFGLATQLSEISQLATSDAVVGTPAFMSPEQASGNREQIGVATDVWGLGAILYYLLTGEPPFSGNNALETLNRVGSVDPVPPRKINPSIPRDLESICLKCLNKSPERRYTSAYALQQDLERFLEDQPVIARPVSRSQKLVRWCRRNPAMAGFSLIMIGLFLIALASSSAGWYFTRSALARERIANDLAQQRSTDLKNAFDDLFTSIAMAPEVNLPGAEPLRQRLLNSVEQYYRETLDAQPANVQLLASHVETINRIAGVKNQLHDYAGALADATAAFRIAESIDSQDADLLVAGIHSQLVRNRALAELGRKSDFQEESRRSIHWIKQAELQDEQKSIELAAALSSMAAAALKLGERTLANEFSQEAVETWESLEDIELEYATRIQKVDCYITAGTALGGSENSEMARTRLAAAIELAEPMLEDLEKNNPEFVSRVSTGMRNLATVSNDPVASEALFARSLLLQEFLMQRHPLIPRYAVPLPRLWYAQALKSFLNGDHQNASDQLRRCIAETETLVDRFPTQKLPFLRTLADSFALLGYAQENLDRLEGALAAMQKSKAINEELLVLSSGSTQHQLQLQGIIGGIANVHSKLGQQQQAIELLRSSCDQLQELLDQDPENGQCKRFLGGNLESLYQQLENTSDWEQALAAFDRLIKLENRGGSATDAAIRARLNVKLANWEQANLDVQRMNSNLQRESTTRSRLSAAKASLKLLRTIDASGDDLVEQTTERAQLMEPAVDITIETLDHLNSDESVTEDHWRALFPDQVRDEPIAAIRNWRQANGR